MATAAVRAPSEFESSLRSYIRERLEEGRAVRVGEKEVSEQATIVARYGHLFSYEHLDSLRAAWAQASGHERERLYRLAKTCESGLVSAVLVEHEDALENAVLATRIEFQGEEMPLRAAEARLAVLPGYRDRAELGELEREATARLNPERIELLAEREELEAEISGEAEPVARNEEEKGLSLIHI